MPVRLMIREYAQRQGFSNARELAAAAGLTPSIVYAYWNDKVENFNRHTLEKLANALGIPEPGNLITRVYGEMPKERTDGSQVSRASGQDSERGRKGKGGSRSSREGRQG